MFQRTCHRPKSALTGFLAEHVLPADKALAAGKAHFILGALAPVDPSLAPLLAGARQGPSRRCRWPASAGAGDAAARAV